MNDTPARYWNARRLSVAVLVVALTLGPIAWVFYRAWWHVPRQPGGAGMSFAGPRSAADSFDLSQLTLGRDQILSGGPSKDGIPSLTRPPSVPVAEADFLEPRDRVVGVTVAGESRAYPINVLNWHEAINDDLGGVPIAVVYCPLCDSVSVVDRRLNDKTLEFGISGLLHNSNVLLYDRTDQALWSQVGLTAVSGPNAGKSLRHLDDWQITTFERWRNDHPRSSVVSFDTGQHRNYRMNPYESYFMHETLMFPVTHRDARLPNKAPVVGVRVGGVSRAYPLAALKLAAGEDGIVRDTIAGQSIELRLDPDEQSVAVVNVPDDAQVVYTFWFAWAAFHRDTELFDPARR